MITVIIPSYNQAGELPKTLENILAQSYCDIEVIVVDDGSTDTTAERIEPFRDRITYIKLEQNRGRQIARNIGLSHARGAYVIVCDADIVMAHNMLEKMAAVLDKNPDIAFVYSGFRWGWKAFPSFPFDPSRLRKMNYINMATLVRRELYPPFDESLKKFQDWDIWLTLTEQGHRGYHIPEILFSLGQRKGGLSSWLPRIAYKIPWQRFGMRVEAIEKYETGLSAIRQKHHL